MNFNNAVKTGFNYDVVRTPDTDIFFIIMHYAHTIKLTIYLDTGMDKHRKFVDVFVIAKSLGRDYCDALLRVYVFIGEDCISAFKVKGKVVP